MQRGCGSERLDSCGADGADRFFYIATCPPPRSLFVTPTEASARPTWVSAFSLIPVHLSHPRPTRHFLLPPTSCGRSVLICYSPIHRPSRSHCGPLGLCVSRRSLARQGRGQRARCRDQGQRPRGHGQLLQAHGEECARLGAWRVSNRHCLLHLTSLRQRQEHPPPPPSIPRSALTGPASPRPARPRSRPTSTCTTRSSPRACKTSTSSR